MDQAATAASELTSHFHSRSYFLLQQQKGFLHKTSFHSIAQNPLRLPPPVSVKSRSLSARRYMVRPCSRPAPTFCHSCLCPPHSSHTGFLARPLTVLGRSLLNMLALAVFSAYPCGSFTHLSALPRCQVSGVSIFGHSCDSVFFPPKSFTLLYLFS